MLAAIGSFHHRQRRERRETLCHKAPSLDPCGLMLHAPPLVRYFMCHHIKRKVERLRTILRISEGEPLLVIDYARVGMHSYPMTGPALDGTIRVRTELLAVVIQRSLNYKWAAAALSVLVLVSATAFLTFRQQPAASGQLQYTELLRTSSILPSHRHSLRMERC